MSDNNALDPDYLDETSKTNIEDYICCICQSIPNPETALEEENCGHLFCETCINQWLVKSKDCPFCKEIISKRSIKDKNKIIYRHLINLVVLCQEDNCNWKGTWKEYYDHLNTQHNKKIELKSSTISNNCRYELYKYYKATTHEHPLKYLDLTTINGWCCDGIKLPCKCLSGITGFRQTNEIKRFRCEQCDYDLCELCMNKYYDPNYPIKNDDSYNRGLYLYKKNYYCQIHNHPLIFLGISQNNDWCCDGKNLIKKCFSGITGFDQTYGIPRFRCEKCDFDLCENCMNNYKLRENYELNKSYKVSVHPHSLKYVGTSQDNGWGCDGRFLPDKCLSSITDFNQTKGFDRFRCEKCDYDLCRNCMDNYHFQSKHCIIF